MDRLEYEVEKQQLIFRMRTARSESEFQYYSDKLSMLDKIMMCSSKEEAKINLSAQGLLCAQELHSIKVSSRLREAVTLPESLKMRNKTLLLL